MKAWRYALKLLLRDYRAGELRLLAAALVVSVAAVSSVAWLADRVGEATSGRAAELLAADRVLEGAESLADRFAAKAAELGMQTTRSVGFPSVVLSGDRTQLVAVKAVETGYPLRGELLLQSGLGAPERRAEGIPPRGEIWIEPRLLSLLDLEVGETLSLGAMDFRISELLALDAARGNVFVSLAPQVMINRADLAATDLIQPASRVRYNLLLAGAPATVDAYEAWLERQDLTGIEVERPTDSQRGVGEVIERARRFLGLSALLTLVVAGVAMLMTVRRYAARQVDRVAVMRCLGATQRDIGWLMVWKLIWLGLFAGGIGVLAGLGLQAGMLALLSGLLPETLPAPGWRPAVVGWLTAYAGLLGFALPTFLGLRHVPPLRVLRRDLTGRPTGAVTLYAAALGVVLALMWWQASDVRLALTVFAAVLGTLLLLGAAAAGLVWLIRRRQRRGAGLLQFTGLVRRPVTSTIQIVAVGLGLMALLLLTVVRTDLLTAWRDRIPDDAPNYFLINIQPSEVPELEGYLNDTVGVDTRLYPMIRGRLVEINGEDVAPEDFPPGRARGLVEREFNLSFREQPAEGNRVIQGDWWRELPAQPPDQFSVEQGVADELGIAMGDRLTFRVAGRTVSAGVTNIREVQWDSFNVNFFVVSPPGLMEDFPATYITSFYLPPDRTDVLPELVRRYPSVTLFDVGTILRTVRSIIDQGARVVELMASLTLVAGIIVLLAALQVTAEERRFETALMRALGATKQRIRRMIRWELLLIGGLAGLLAGGVAAVAGHAVAVYLFDLEYALRPVLVGYGVLAGAAVVWLAGGVGTLRYYRVSPMRLLRAPENG
ncbi:FtsX-like permease family protein [Ectothiorhodospiraceae bacterium WFHF3C12]|nr:FtsX-like permease family protein [Ectothiorhodospiraceae bacterium WFHF3C12]